MDNLNKLLKEVYTPVLEKNLEERHLLWDPEAYVPVKPLRFKRVRHAWYFVKYRLQETWQVFRHGIPYDY